MATQRRREKWLLQAGDHLIEATYSGIYYMVWSYEWLLRPGGRLIEVAGKAGLIVCVSLVSYLICPASSGLIA